ncbi:hypothetical protein BGZ73_004256 [Actinomortierella ambigua]|nr:hypothetical protein BGZ73_004256 [Actinomortierella ambigua]
MAGGVSGSSSSTSNSSTEYSESFLMESSASSSSASYMNGSSTSSHRQKRAVARPMAFCNNPALSDSSSSSSSSSDTCARPEATLLRSSSRSLEADLSQSSSNRQSSFHLRAQVVSSSLPLNLPPLHPSRLHQHQQVNPAGPLDNISGVAGLPERDVCLPSRMRSASASSAAHPLQEMMGTHSPHMVHADTQVSTPPHSDAVPMTAAESPSRGPEFGDVGGGGGEEEDPAIRRAEQNRAAQRAFRLRKQKYIKWLESKASELDEVYRIMAIVRAENQQLCNIVMELRSHMRQLSGGMNPGLASGHLGGNNSSGKGVGGGSSTATMALGHGIEVIQVGDHYESTLGREISARLMNLGTFKNGGSEGRPRYQPRASSSSSSSGSPSKRKSATPLDQSWSQQNIDQLSSSLANGGILEKGIHGVQGQNQGEATPMEGVTTSSPGITSGGTNGTVVSTVVMPGAHFGTLQDLAYAQPAAVPLTTTTWTNSPGRFPCEESQSPSTFPTPAAHSTRSAASNTPNHVNPTMGKPGVLPVSIQTNPSILTSSFLPLSDDSPKMLAKPVMSLNGSADLSLKRHSMMGEVTALPTAPLSYSPTGATSFSIRNGQQPMPLPANAAHSDIVHTTGGQSLVGVLPMVTLPAAPMATTVNAHAPLGRVIPVLPNSNAVPTTVAPGVVSSISAAAAATTISPGVNGTGDTSTPTLLLHTSNTSIQVLTPATMGGLQPQVAQLSSIAEPVAPVVHTLSGSTLPMASHSAPPQMQHPHPHSHPHLPPPPPPSAIHSLQTTPSPSAIHPPHHSLVRTLGGLDPCAMEKGRRLSMPTIHLALPTMVTAAQASAPVATAIPPQAMPPVPPMAPPTTLAMAHPLPVHPMTSEALPVSGVLAMHPQLHEWHPMA